MAETNNVKLARGKYFDIFQTSTLKGADQSQILQGVEEC